MTDDSRLFAVVPAAGESRRMGRPKLLLPLGGVPVIARLLDVLRRDEIAVRVVVVRPGDVALRTEAEAADACVVEPATAPPDMRASVEYGLQEIRRRFAPGLNDGWLLVPADHPVLVPEVLDTLLGEWMRHTPRILVPRFGDRRGHPAIFRWDLADEVASIPADQGLNHLLHRHANEVREVPIDDEAVVTDLDTPEDFARLQRRWEQQD